MVKTNIDLQNVGGWTRQGKSLTRAVEDKFYDWLTDQIPDWVNPNWFTLMSPFFTLAVIFAALKTRTDPNFLWVAPIMIFVHYVADCLDGKLARKQKKGYILWGFYMDHFLDCIFNNSILLGLLIVYPQDMIILGIGMVLICASMLAETLHAATIGTYRIYGQFGFGSTEGTFFSILATGYLATFQPERMPRVVFVAFAVVLLQLSINVYQTQRELAQMDMANKKLKSAKADSPQK